MSWKPPQDKVTTTAWKPPADAVFSDSNQDGKGIIRRSAEAVVDSHVLPIAGSVLGGVAGVGAASIPLAGLGAAAGESYRQLAARYLGLKSPKTSMEAAKDIGIEGAAGAASEGALKVLGIAAKPFKAPLERGVAKLGKGAANVVEAITGVKPPDVIQAAKQGVKTYLAPGMERAQEIFGNALEKSGIKARPPLKQIIDPQLGVARKIAIEVGTKLENKLPLTAEEALRGRQAIDRIYAATPILDRSTRSNLLDIRGAFDKALSEQSGALAEASDIYRKAIVKSKILNPFRITKQGQLSAVTPILASTIGSGVGFKNNSAAGGAGAAAATLGATSPLLWGAGITTGADLVRLASSPVTKRVILQSAIRRYFGQKNAKQSQE